MKIISGILTIGAGLFLVNRMGINTVGLFNLKKFSDKADFKVRHLHGFNVVGGMNGYIKFLLDIEVINPENFSITAENLRIKAFNERSEYIGESLPYHGKVVIAPNSTTLIPNIEVHAKTSNTLFDYTLPALLEIIRTGNWQQYKFNKTVKLNISLSLNGYEINKNESYRI
jgi:hypothetical protein